MELACRREHAGIDGRSFGNNLRLISSVSGGSVGTMYFVNAYEDDKGLPDEAQLRRVVDYAETSSLDPAIKGLVYPDFLRTILPYSDDFAHFFRGRSRRERGESDRGQWLQDAWTDAPLTAGRFSNYGGPPPTDEDMSTVAKRLKNATLASWRHDVRLHRRPAVIFNASNADTGGRYLLATTSFYGLEDEYEITDAKRALSKGRLEFAREHPDLTVKVATAARLSATFPYVSPAACADLRDPRLPTDNKPNWRLVDGGYTNNSG